MSVSFWVIRNGVMQVAENDLGTKTWPLSPEIFQYPGGEYSLRNVPVIENVDAVTTVITWVAMVRGAKPSDLIKAALLADVARQRDDKFVLLIPYLPAARADRGAPLGAQIYADIINTMDAHMVVTLDAHSTIMPDMITNCRDLSPVDHIVRSISTSPQPDRPYTGVICPDKGALWRAEALAEEYSLDVYHAEKNRDFVTGAITGIHMKERLPYSGRFLVVDDICDGGGTFRALAEVVKPYVSRLNLDLWITHGIFSGKADGLREDYANIMTTDSHPGHNRVGVATSIVPVFPTMFEYARKA